MRRLIWIAAIGVLLVAGVLLVRALLGVLGQPPNVQHGGGVEPGAPTRMIQLFYGSRDRVGLEGEDRAIPDLGGEEAMIERIVTEYLRGSRSRIAGFNPAVRVRGVFLAQDGTVYLDLTSELLTRWPRGDGLEWVSVGGLVCSITENVPAARRIQILVEGKIIERPPGAIAIDLPLEPVGFRGFTEDWES